MWRYYKVVDPVNGGGKPLALVRVDGVEAERYAGLDRWVRPEYAGAIVMDVSGMGDGWSKYMEVQPEKVEGVKAQLFPDDLEALGKG